MSVGIREIGSVMKMSTIKHAYTLNFAYPFKRRSNSDTKTKSTHELYEEILFKDYQGQYLFNRSGLFHGGVHLYEDRFPINDFDTDGIRAIADGKIIYYRIDEEFLENELDDGTILKYSSSFMLLEHEIEYPATNILKFYSLYMHMAPASEYEFIEHVLDGEPVYVRDIDGADMSIARGTKVTLGKSFKDKDVGTGLTDKKNRYEVLSYGNNIKPPANEGWNVHITNLKKVVVTTVKGSSTNKPNIRKGSKNNSPFVKLLTVGDSIEVNAFQTEQEKASKRYAVISVNGRPIPVTYPRTTISKDNLTDTITEPKINNLENGFVTKHMTSQRRAVLPTSGLGIEVKAGDVLGKMGCYNTKEWENEMELVTHVEAFTFHDDLEKFIEDATTEYTKSTTELNSTQKAAYDKVRPKENQIYISEEKPRYAKEQHSTYLYVKLKEADNLRQVGATRTILRGRKTNNGTLFKVKPLVSGAKRYEVISIEEGDDVLTTVENEKKWSVYEPNVEIIGTFIEIPNSSKDFYKSIIKPLKTLKKLKDKEGTTYVLLENQQGIDVYVKESDIEKTHGITFKAFSYMEGEGEKKVGIFDDISKYYSKREDEIPQQDKEKLNELFGKVLKHIKLDKDESEERNTLEAGEFAALSKSNLDTRRAMSHILIKHESEWKNEKEKFTPVLDYMKNHNQNDRKMMFEDRLKNLAFFPDVHIGRGKTPTFIHPIALVEGFVGECACDIPITVEILASIFPNSSVLRRQEVSDAINKYCNEFSINTLDRMAHFLAQIGTETGQLNSLYENYRYGATAIYNTFLRKVTYPHPTQRGKYTFKYHDLIEGYNANCSTCPHATGNYGHNRDVLNPIAFNLNSDNLAEWSPSQFLSLYSIKNEYIRNTALFDYVYGCRMGNGAKPTEDGSDYFGVGFIHMTGKSKYINLNRVWNQRYPNDRRNFLGDDVSLLKTNVDIAMKAAMIHWSLVENINDIAINDTNPTIRAVTFAVNGGTNGLNDRVAFTATAYRVLRENF